MAYKVLIVDDSSFFQHRLKEIIGEHPDLEVVGIASNGREAIDKAKQLEPDIISMDYEMPYLDGVSAVRAIMAERPVPIVMFSSMTYEGATITLEALDAGAVDFIPKNFAEVSRNSAILKKKLHEKLIGFASNANPAARRNTSDLAAEANERSQRAKERTAALRARMSARSDAAPTSPSAPVAPSPRPSVRLKGRVKIVAIGASTGGPVALSDIITNLPANFPLPLVVVQHMPENFTRAFAERLNRLAQVNVKEAESGDALLPGHVLIAPGGKQMIVDRGGRSVKIIDGDDRVNYKPCVDITFASIASNMGGDALAIVLTGMGADGCEGAKLLKSKGAAIWSQDQETSVVYGMPAAVARAGLSDEVLPLDEVCPRLLSEF
ncbi:protein-glutamate methylesterase/protein-glutamine glutaminase [Teredinibacter turnerae]|uniref:protein-glutamate methylesterase/protein-glutamine glutaminase n=1 Tax=Teredinibacter turnerae TaxID=2426 RepID=UPI00036E69D2|nr:chemotaxis response regulator protein-glutamate methylesterase [Teredinibacter turnerae]